MKKKNSFSIIIPVLNEEKNIQELIFLIRSHLKKYIYEIIFVDDNSQDGTKEIILRYVSPEIHYFVRKKNKDLTKSCFLGIQKSVYENIIIMDGDLQHNPSYLPKIINLFFKKKADFVVAVRNFNKNQEMSLIRNIFSQILSKIFNFFLGYKVSDPMSGFFMFRKSIYFKHKKKLFGKGWKILADLIYNKDNFNINEFQIKFLKRTKNFSKMNYKVLNNIIFLFFYKLYLLYIK